QGIEIESTAKRLARYRAVANTYISAFQTLGGFGLLLGTLGLGAVVLRNVLERRGELALLRAVGFSNADIGKLVVAENAMLLLAGLLFGSAAATVAILPQLAHADGLPNLAPLAGILLAAIAIGLGGVLLGVATALRTPLIPALRSE
ncbi:MAG TPA: ABC transporter permease, partial [Planctomycetia bacterium]|nr:ABC transporter permease [Planctomycetia bacterium]